MSYDELFSLFMSKDESNYIVADFFHSKLSSNSYIERQNCLDESVIPVIHEHRAHTERSQSTKNLMHAREFNIKMRQIEGGE